MVKHAYVIQGGTKCMRAQNCLQMHRKNIKHAARSFPSMFQPQEQLTGVGHDNAIVPDLFSVNIKKNC